MPGSPPPKRMFRTITAIRENTGKILQLLEPGQPEPARDVSPPPNDWSRREERADLDAEAQPGGGREDTMKVLTVYAHQNPRSFCHGVLEHFTEGLRDAGHAAMAYLPGHPAGKVHPASQAAR